jgi:hypothetical protein
MPEFVPNQPVTLEKGVVDVTFGATVKSLDPGTHTFQLVVVDDLGVSSDPVQTKVTVQGKPIADLNGPSRVAAGQSFQLDGSKSISAGGKITKWIFTRIVTG